MPHPLPARYFHERNVTEMRAAVAAATQDDALSGSRDSLGLLGGGSVRGDGLFGDPPSTMTGRTIDVNDPNSPYSRVATVRFSRGGTLPSRRIAPPTAGTSHAIGPGFGRAPSMISEAGSEGACSEAE